MHVTVKIPFKIGQMKKILHSIRYSLKENSFLSILKSYEIESMNKENILQLFRKSILIAIFTKAFIDILNKVLLM